MPTPTPYQGASSLGFAPSPTPVQPAVKTASVAPTVTPPPAPIKQPEQPAKPVTAFSSDTANQYVADNNQKLQTLKNTGLTLGQDGLARYSDQSFASAPSDAVQGEDGTWQSGGVRYALGPATTQDPELQKISDQITQMKTQFDTTSRANIDNIQQQFQSLMKEQADINSRSQSSLGQSLLMSGSSRYAQLSSSGEMTQLMSAGLKSLADLNVRETSAVIAAQQAQDTGDMQLMDKQISIATQARKDKQAAAADLSKQLATKAENIRIEKQKTQDKVNQIALDAQKNGASPATIAAIQASTSEAGAIAAAGDSLQTATGDAGAYLFEKRQAEAAGKVAPSYQSWQAALDKRKLDAEITKLKLSEGIKFDYAVALEKAKKNLVDAPNPNYNGEFAATIKLASQAGGTNAQRQQIVGDMQDFIAQGDYQSAYAQVLSSVSSKLKGTNAQNFEQQLQSYDTISSLKDSLTALKDAGYDTNLLKGGADAIQTKIGTLMTDPKYAAIATQLNMNFQNYRLNMTGAAFSGPESAEYASVLPSSGNTFSLNMAKIEGAQNYLDSVTESAIKHTVGEGGVYIKQYAQASKDAANNTQTVTNKMATFRAADPKNEQMVQEMHSQFPDWTIDQISEALGI